MSSRSIIAAHAEPAASPWAVCASIIAINKHSGKIEAIPEIVSRGFALESDPEFMKSARAAVQKTLDASSAEEKGDVGVMKEKIRADLKRFISRETQRRPMIMPVILEI